MTCPYDSLVPSCLHFTAINAVMGPSIPRDPSSLVANTLVFEDLSMSQLRSRIYNP
jgi:hypothetical protein